MKRLLLGIIFFAALNAVAQDSLNIRCVSQQGMWQMLWGVAVQGNYAYLAAYEDGLQVMDVTDPANPIAVGSCDTPGFAWNVIVQGNYAYIPDRISGLRIIDISNPAAPVEVGFYDTPGEATDVEVRNGIAYVADDERGLRILDVSNPHAPTEIGHCDSAVQAVNVSITDSFAYTVDNWGSLSVIDIHDPTSPIRVAYWLTPDERVVDVAIYGNYAYVSCWGEYFFGLRILDISNPALPAEVASCRAGSGRIFISGHYLYMSEEGYIIDISNPIAPVVVTSCYSFYVVAKGIAVSNNYLYVAAHLDGLYAFDLSNIASPVEISNYIPRGWAIDVFVRDTLAYVSSYYSGLWVMDISDPSAPLYVGTCPIGGGYGPRLVVDGHYVFMVGREGGLNIIDISDPATPTHIGYFHASGLIYSWGVAVNNGYAYIAEGGSILRVLNVSDPTAPFQVGLCDVAGQLSSVVVEGNYAYVASTWGMTIVDIANPEFPSMIGRVQTNRGVSIAVSGSYVYMTDGDSGLVVIDASDPTTPTVIGVYHTHGFCYDVVTDGHFVYVTDWETGLHVINIEDPSNPREVGFYNTPGHAQGIDVSGHLAYVAGNNYFGIYDCSAAMPAAQRPPSAPIQWSLNSVFPNPFNPSTQITFSVPQSERVMVNVYNIAGQLVATLLDDRLTPGLHAVRFDGSDLSSGVYLCRLNSPGFAATRKMILVK